MRFRGKKALVFQVAYTDDFNAMASYIKNQYDGLGYRCMEKELECKDSARRGSLHGKGLNQRKQEKPVLEAELGVAARHGAAYAATELRETGVKTGVIFCRLVQFRAVRLMIPPCGVCDLAPGNKKTRSSGRGWWLSHGGLFEFSRLCLKLVKLCL